MDRRDDVSKNMELVSDNKTGEDKTVEIVFEDNKGHNAEEDTDETGDSAATHDSDSESGESESSGRTKRKKYTLMLPWKLFRFAGLLDVLLIILGTLGAIGIGSALPIHMLIFGNILNIMINYTTVTAETLPNVIYVTNNCTPVSFSSDSATLGHFCNPIAGNLSANATLGISDDFLIARLQRLAIERQPFLMDCDSYNRSLLLQSQMAMEEFSVVNNYFFYDEMLQYVFIYLGIAVAALLCGYAQSSFWNTAAYRQGYKIRQRFFKSLMYQDNSWYDTNKSSGLSTRLADDVEKIQSGIGEKAGLFLQYVSTFLVGYIVGFVQGWQLTLVIISVFPLLLLLAMVFTMITARLVKFEQKNYAAAGSIAEEVLAAIRTVAAFGGENREVDRYGKELKKARKVGYIKSLIIGILMALLFFVLFACYALAFGYGSVLILDCEIQAGQVITVFLSVLIGTFSLGQALPELETFASAMGSASYVFKVIDREPDIISNEEGERPDDLSGNIEFKDVTFSYPSRDQVQVLNGLSFTVKRGQTLALVGPSGCGKSTTVQLLQRFYDVKTGNILVDGLDIRSYNLNWLRSKIGIVSQEPNLFATSIAENIRLGFPGASQKQIEEAAKAANAHNFIMTLPDKYNTVIGSRATQLSGGQKQRIAIARALVRDPKILLLDEATSALDTESESVVQSALDQARRGRTTIIIAHRLSTIRTADVITSIEGGVAVESGTHDELMMDNGLYRELVTAQSGGGDVGSDEPLADFKAALERPKKLTFKKTKRGTKKASVRDTPNTPVTPYTPHEDTPTSLGYTPTAVGYTPTPVLDKYEVAKPKAKSRSIENIVLASPFIERRDFTESPPGDSTINANELTIENGLAVKTGDKSLRRLTRGFAKLRGKKKDEDAEDIPPVPFKDMLKLNLPDWYLVIPGVVSASLIGVMFPALAVLLSGALGSFGSTDREVVREGGVFYAGMFLVIATIAALLNFIQAFFLNAAGERLTKRLRLKSFKAMLRQDIGWFDDRRRSPGALTTRLAVDATEVKGATGLRFGTTFQVIVGVIAAIIVAFTASWELSFVVMLCFPFIFLAGFFQLRLQAGRALKNKETFESCGQVSAEAIENIKTVQAFGLEENRFDAYHYSLRKAVKWSVLGVLTQGIVAAVAQSLIFLMYTIGFSFGPYLMIEGRAGYDDIYRVFIAVVVTSLSLGRAASFAGDVDKAKTAAARVMHLINSVPAIDVTTESGTTKDRVDGSIVFSNVEFSYPTRDEVPVLKKLNLTVHPGQKVALVGPSGCGKSTVVSLLERFYDPTPVEGSSITLDGEDLRDVNLKWLRSQMGIVSQEPVLFNSSIADNIRYGANDREVTDEEIEQAAKNANIHNFISSLPQGYDTDAGARGTQLSGGQKQRIAIARALVRDPKILLLDEATSALDTESEKIVQEALDRAQEGRTCIVIAHRLSTIQHSDLIVVIHDGRVLESGTHTTLMARRGAYYLLNTVSANNKEEGGYSISQIAEMSDRANSNSNNNNNNNNNNSNPPSFEMKPPSPVGIRRQFPMERRYVAPTVRTNPARNQRKESVSMETEV